MLPKWVQTGQLKFFELYQRFQFNELGTLGNEC